MKKLIYILIIIIILIIFVFIKVNNDKVEKVAIEKINSYYLLWQEEKFDDAMELLYIPKEIEALREIHYQSLQEIDLKQFNINNAKKYNKNLYGFDINIKVQYIDNNGKNIGQVFNENITPYVANIDNTWYVVINQDFLPEELVTNNVPKKEEDPDAISPFDIVW